MQIRRAMVLLFILAQLLIGEDSVAFSLRPSAGSVFKYSTARRQLRTSSKSAVESVRDIDLEYATTFEILVVSSEPRAVRLKKTLTSASLRGREDGLEIDYDSSRGDPEPMRYSPAWGIARQVGDSFEVLIDHTGRIVDDTEFNALVSRVMSDIPEGQVGVDFGGEGLAQIALEGLSLQFPRWSAAPGCCWSASHELMAFHGVRFVIHESFRFAGISAQGGRLVAKIASTSTPRLDTSRATGLDLVVRLDGSDESSTEVDVLTGIVLRKSSKSHSRIEYNFSTGGMPATEVLETEESRTLSILPE